MTISEFESAIGPEGSLVIPASEIERMGLRPNDSVYVAYIADDALRNRFREFLVSPSPLETLGEAAQISVPEELLRDAHISEGADVQIICIDGAIILCQESALRSEDLSQILQTLDIAVDLADSLPQDTQVVIESLRQHIDNCEEKGAKQHEA